MNEMTDIKKEQTVSATLGELIQILSNDRTLLVTAIALCILQVADGILTTVGVTHLGVHMEGNIFIRALMETWGTIPAIALLKTSAILIILTLCLISTKVRWVKGALQVMSFLYLFAAVLPWTYIILDRVL